MTFQASSYAYRGVLDLRLESLQTPYSLSGEWEIYWKQFVSPGQVPNEKNYVEFPQLWNGLIIGTDTLTRKGYASYRLKVLLSDNPSDYDLLVDDMYNSYTLYVNGEIRSRNGVVASNEKNSIPQWKPVLVKLKQVSGPIEIILHISNWRHSKGGNMDPIFISNAGILSGFLDQSTSLQWVLFVVFVGISVFFIYRFAFKSYDFASLFYSLFLLIYAYRLIGTDLYPLHRWIDSYPWDIALHIEYLSLFTSVLFFGFFVYYLYPQDTSRRMMMILFVISTVFIAMVLVTKPYYFTQMLSVYLVILVGYIIYGFYIYTFAVIHNRRGAILGMVGAAVVFTVIIYQIFYFYGWLQYDFPVMFYAHLIFVIFQSIQVYIKSSSQNVKTVI